MDTLLGDYRTGTAQDAETTSAITAALLAYYTSSQVDALLGDYRTRRRRRPSRARCWPRTRTSSQPTKSPRRWWRTAQPQTRTRRRPQASPPRCSATTPSRRWTVCWPTSSEAALALQIAVRFPHNGGADEVVAAIGEQILAPTDVSLSNWTVRRCSVVLATHTAGVSVDGYTLTLAANPWNIVRTPGPRAPLRLPLPARHGLQLRGVHVRGRQRLRPIVRQLRGRPGGLEHGQDVLHRQTEWRSCTSLRTSRRRACPTRRQERWTSTGSRSWTQPWRPATRTRRTRRPRHCC